MVLVSILGDFHSSILPIFFNFKEQLTKHVLVYDDAKKDISNARSIQKGIHKFQKKENHSFESIEYKLDEDSFEALQKSADFILSLSADPTEIYINTTDGYSTLTTILHHHLFEHGVNFIAYDMYDNQYNLLNKNGLTSHCSVKNIDIKNHFLLKGFKTESSSLKDFAKLHKKAIKQIFEIYSDAYDAFLQIDPYLYPTISDLRGKHEKIKTIFLDMEMSFGALSTTNALLTGSLFECYVYLLLKDMDFDDIEVGFKVMQKYNTTKIKNEFDIFVMKNNHLHMVECKYKNFVKVDELVYKYTALANIIDEDGKMAIVTKKAPKYDHHIDNHEHKGISYKRGRLNNIYFYGAVNKNKEKFQQEIKALFQI